MTMFAFSRPTQLRICGWIAACTMAGTAAFGAQTPAPRIRSEVSSSYMSTLKGSLHPLAQPRFDAGRVPSDTRLNGMTIVFNRSAAQQADLEALLAAQQNPSSPLFHKWLTPEQYAARFGMNQADIDSVSLWLQQQGFSVDSVARSKNMVHFSGSVGQVEMAFQTQMHYYNVEGAKHFAPSTELSLPAAIAPTVAAVMNLSDFRPKPQYIPLSRTRGAFTSSISGSVFFAPGDIKVVYDMTPLVSGGNDGTGQSLVVVGQSYVNVSDIANFQSAAGLPNKPPTLVLVPGSGTGTTTVAGDEGESDLDLEWSSAMAPGANVFFVYTGSDTQNFSVFDSIQYAVDQKLGNIISVSYGACESGISQTEATALETSMSQAATQGQTIISASGDQGSTACFIENPPQGNDPPLATQEALAVSYPASSAYVTGVGGTEISAADNVDTNSTYWDAQTSSDILTSAKIYIPEVAWNDEAFLIANQSSGLSASGGGASALFAKPSWQTGVPGIPNDSKRDVPDVALYSSPSFPGYLYCTSDQSDWSPASGSTAAQAASCNSGFRDSSTKDLTIAGGTSFAAPIFAGMMAIINQKSGYTTGQGLINPKLYTLASNSATYAAAFHDVTSGNNECLAGTTFCSTTSGSTTSFTTNAGYDLVTGLGSVDLNALATAWTASTTSPIATSTTVAASSLTPALNANDTFTITVASSTGSTVPTGTVAITVDGTTATGSPFTLTANGTYAEILSFTVAGAHTVVAQYSGDATHAPSTGALTVTVPGSTTPGTFKLAATAVTVSQGSSANSTITVTPAGGYTGTVDLSFTTSNNNALANLCYNFTTTLSNGDGSVAVTGTSAVTTQLTLDTNASDCVAAAVILGSKPGLHRFAALGNTAKNSHPSGPNPAPFGVAFAGLLLAGFLGRASRKFRTTAGLIAMLAVGFAISACGGGSSSGGTTPPSNPAKGTYTFTLTGQDSASATNTATTTFTLTIQ